MLTQFVDEIKETYIEMTIVRKRGRMNFIHRVLFRRSTHMVHYAQPASVVQNIILISYDSIKSLGNNFLPIRFGKRSVIC